MPSDTRDPRVDPRFGDELLSAEGAMAEFGDERRCHLRIVDADMGGVFLCSKGGGYWRSMALSREVYRKLADGSEVLRVA